MTLRILASAALAVTVVGFPVAASALTMGQVASICNAGPSECSKHPLIQAYVGGALDLIATLDEATDYLDDIYCKPPAELFDVPAIIRYMRKNEAAYTDRNAMLLVIRYLEEQGGC